LEFGLQKTKSGQKIGRVTRKIAQRNYIKRDGITQRDGIAESVTELQTQRDCVSDGITERESVTELQLHTQRDGIT